tara:strand:- start:9228 stop:9527 length:300 start_codon:yes stop_codon:yes gene_type:complete
MPLNQHDPRWVVAWKEGNDEALKHFDDTEQAEEFCLMKLGTEDFSVINAWSGEIAKPTTALAVKRFLMNSSAPIKNPEELIDHLKQNTGQSKKTREPRL